MAQTYTLRLEVEGKDKGAADMLDGLKGDMKSAGDAAGRMGDSMAAGFKNAESAASSLGSKISAGMKSAGESAQRLGAGLTAGVTLPILGFAAAAIKGAADAEQLEVSFTTMLGSAEKAQTLIAQLSKFAATTPFETPEIANAGKQLLAFGVSADDIIPTLTKLGDISAGLNIPLGDMAYLFGTNRAQGKLMTGDLNQLASRGVPIIAALAKTMGVAESSIKDMASEGKISFDDFNKALDSLTEKGGQFSGLMEAQSGTFSGLLSTMSDNVGLTMTEIGKAIIEGFDLKGGLLKFIGFLEKAKNAIIGLAKSNPALFKMGLIIAGVAAAAGPLLIAFGTLLTVLAPLGPAFAVMVGPVGLVVAGIAALVALNWDSITDGLYNFSQYLRYVVVDGDSYNDFLKNLPQFIQPAAQSVGQLVDGFLKYRDAVSKTRFGSIEAQTAIGRFPEPLRNAISFLDRTAEAFLSYKDAVSKAGVDSDLARGKIALFPPALQGVVKAFSDAKTTFDNVGGGIQGAVAALGAVTGGTVKFNAVITHVDWTTQVGNIDYTYNKLAQITRIDWTGSVGNLSYLYNATTAITWVYWKSEKLGNGSFVYNANAGILNIDWTGKLGPESRVAFSYDSVTGIKHVFWDEPHFHGYYESTTGIIDVDFGEGFYTATYSTKAKMFTAQSVLWGGWTHTYDAESKISETGVGWGFWHHTYDAGAKVETAESVWWGAYKHTYDAGAKVQTSLDVAWGGWTWKYDVGANVLEQSVVWGAWSYKYDVGAQVLYNRIFWGAFGYIYDVGANVTTFTIMGKPAQQFFNDLFAGLTLGFNRPNLAGLNKEDPARDIVTTPSWVTSLLNWQFPSPAALLEWAFPSPSDLLGWGWPKDLGGLTGWHWPKDLGGLSSWDWPDMSMPGWVSSLIAALSAGSGAGGEKVTDADIYRKAAGNATGTSNWRGGMTWVGERGPELVNLPRGSQVYTNQQSMAMASASGPPVIVYATVASPIDVESLAYRIADIQRRKVR